jgi:arylsulfatase A-like enzyme
MLRIFGFALLLLCLGPVSPVNAADAKPYNVLFLAVDDLNDWVGCLGGHPQAKTPNIDKLATQGVLFESAYAPAPLCNPSRTAILTGLRPSTTGIYGNKTWFRDHPKYKNWVTIPQYFRQHGYTAVTGGKIYHREVGKFSDAGAWDNQYSTRTGTLKPPKGKQLLHGMAGKFKVDYYNSWLDWAPITQPTKETADWKTADGAAKFLQQKHDKPFFLGCGIFRPHLPGYAPKKFFDMHPLYKIQLPTHTANDLDDVPSKGHKMAGDVFEIIQSHGHWKRAIQGYLAACSFADACVGHVLDALAESKYANNTIVVFWGDHGYHVGEKNHFSKSTLWEDATRTPLIIRIPGTKSDRSKRPVSLIDLYPTLIELCGLPKRDDLDGRSIAPLVRNPQKEWPHTALITHSPFWHGTNHAIRSEKYYYIRYSDGGEELYDKTADPHGWKNISNDPKYLEAKIQLRKSLPKTNAKHFRSADK